MRVPFQDLWDSYDEFEHSEPPMCRFAVKFANWIETQCRAGANPTLLEVNQKKLMLQERYFDLYHAIPRSHRRHIGSAGHVCVHHVYMDAYARLKDAQWDLLSPALFMPPRPEPPQYGGIFLGDVDDE